MFARRHSDIFGEYDTGSNNSNSSSSDDETCIQETFPPTNRPVTWEPTKNGIPTQCYCGAEVVVKTHTFGLQIGRRYYSCEGDIRDGECHIYKMWDDAIMEEIAAMKTNVGDLEAGLHHCEEEREEEREKVKEMASKIARSDKEIDDLRNMVVDLQTKVAELLGVHRKIYQL